jgi:serine/threonine-protein kinase
MAIEPGVQTLREVVAPKTLMNPGDWIEFELLVEGYGEDLEVHGRVAGAKLKQPAAPSPAGRALQRMLTATNIGVMIVTICALVWWLSAGRWTTVPNVVGLTNEAAIDSIQERNLDVLVQQADSSRPAGEVVSQSPAPGKDQIRGTDVIIQVSNGP